MAADRRWHKVRCRVHPGYKQTDNHKLAQLQDWQSVKSLKGGEHQKKRIRKRKLRKLNNEFPDITVHTFIKLQFSSGSFLLLMTDEKFCNVIFFSINKNKLINLRFMLLDCGRNLGPSIWFSCCETTDVATALPCCSAMLLLTHIFFFKIYSPCWKEYEKFIHRSPVALFC